MIKDGSSSRRIRERIPMFDMVHVNGSNRVSVVCGI